MNFLAPLFLLGALTVALPIVFHLIRRTTREQTPFSSLMFLFPTPPRVTRRSRLDNILLLLLRCLVICLLALGFARPFLKRPIAAQPDATGTSKVIVLVDASASMRREDLWSQAIDRAESVLRKLRPGDQAAVLSFDQQVRSLVSFGQWPSMNPDERVALAVRRLRETNPSWTGTSLGAALTTAADMFDEADRKKQNPGVRRIILITDLQEGSRLERLQGYEWPRGIEVNIEPIKPKRSTNAGIQLVSSADEALSDSPIVGVRVRVSNSADAQREQFQLRSGNSGGGTQIYVPPGQSRTVSLTNASASVGNRIILEGDDADFDNPLYVIPPRTSQI